VSTREGNSRLLPRGQFGGATVYNSWHISLIGNFFDKLNIIILDGLFVRDCHGKRQSIVCLSSLTGFVTHASISNINWSFILLAAVFAFAGGQVGSRLMSKKLQGRTVRLIFVAVLFFMSARLMYKVLI